MSTPTDIRVPEVNPRDLIDRLETARRQEQEATPPPKFQNECPDQGYDYLCEVEHSKRPPYEIDSLRMSIDDALYWRQEATRYHEELWDAIYKKYGQESVYNSDGWRDVAMALRRRLKKCGYSMQKIRDCRLAIDDQSYWRPEAEHLRRYFSAHEQQQLLRIDPRLRKGHRTPCHSKRRSSNAWNGETLGSNVSDVGRTIPRDGAKGCVSNGYFSVCFRTGPCILSAAKSTREESNAFLHLPHHLGTDSATISQLYTVRPFLVHYEAVTNCSTVMATADLSSIVLLLGNFEGTSGLLDLSENARYVFHPAELTDNEAWKGDQSCELQGPFLRLVFEENMFSPEGWTAGSSSDPDICDIQLATNNQNGVSRRHILIDICPASRQPRVTALSNPIQIHVAQDRRKRKRTVTLAQGESLNIISAVTIDVGEVVFRAWQPTLSLDEQALYRKRAEASSRNVLDAVPRYPVPKDFGGIQTSVIRFGKGNACYKAHETPNTRTGSHASVMKVIELRSQEVFAAKIPHFKSRDPASISRKRRESLSDEFLKITRLRHPNIVEAFDVVSGALPSQPEWLIMEWFDDDLESADVRNSDYPLLFTGLARGLAFMHLQNFTHRDLKPANIVLRMDNGRLEVAKIADFGTTKHDITGEMQTYAGSNVYMAPEFWEEQLEYTNAVDMWSFGMVALGCLTHWDARSEAWDPRFPPSKTKHKRWFRELYSSHVMTAPAQYRPLLVSLLSLSAKSRWTARQAENWIEINMDSISNAFAKDMSI